MALCFDRGTAPRGEGDDAQDADRPAQRQGDDLSGAHFLGALEDAFAVDANMPFMEKRLRSAAALDQPDGVKEAIDPHRFSA